MKLRTLLEKMVKEDGAEDLEKWMNTPLKSMGAGDPTANLSDDAKDIVNKGTADGDLKDDTTISAAGGPQDVPLKKLKASQNEVGMDQSLSNVMGGVNATYDGINWGDVDWLVDHMKPGSTITFKAALLGAKTKDGLVVLDGHHRWSQAFMLNPDASVNVELANASTKTADETLKAVHLAIYAKTGASNTKGAKGGNLFNAGEADIKKYLDKATKVDPNTGEPSDNGVAPYVAAVMRYENISDPIEGEQKAIQRVNDAIKACAATVYVDAPSRDAMPQADSETNPIDAAGALDTLKSGDINYNPPFNVQDSVIKTGKSLNESIDKSRWAKLANIKK